VDTWSGYIKFSGWVWRERISLRTNNRSLRFVNSSVISVIVVIEKHIFIRRFHFSLFSNNGATGNLVYGKNYSLAQSVRVPPHEGLTAVSGDWADRIAPISSPSWTAANLPINNWVFPDISSNRTCQHPRSLIVITCTKCTCHGSPSSILQLPDFDWTGWSSSVRHSIVLPKLNFLIWHSTGSFGIDFLILRDSAKSIST
jgi:hypothetical protein